MSFPAQMTTLKTLCSRCQAPVVCVWPDSMTFGGEPVTPSEYLAKALQSDSVLVACDACLAVMPDVRLEDMFTNTEEEQQND